jgi:hypothetical protein
MGCVREKIYACRVFMGEPERDMCCLEDLDIEGIII